MSQLNPPEKLCMVRAIECDRVWLERRLALETKAGGETPRNEWPAAAATDCEAHSQKMNVPRVRAVHGTTRIGGMSQTMGL